MSANINNAAFHTPRDETLTVRMVVRVPERPVRIVLDQYESGRMMLRTLVSDKTLGGIVLTDVQEMYLTPSTLLCIAGLTAQCAAASPDLTEQTKKILDAGMKSLHVYRPKPLKSKPCPATPPTPPDSGLKTQDSL